MTETADRAFFAAYLKAVADFEKANEEARAAAGAANIFLQSVKYRQNAEKQRLVKMLADLEAEETALRRKVREDMTRRTERALRGEAEPQDGKETAARLIYIPEEKAAIKALSERRSMTQPERDAWENILADLTEKADALSAAISARSRETGKLMDYVNGVKYWATGAARIDVGEYIQEAYALNANGEEDADNEE